MSTRDLAIDIFNSLSEEKLQKFISIFADEDTIARMECDAIMNDPDPKLYNNFKEFMTELEQENG